MLARRLASCLRCGTNGGSRLRSRELGRARSTVCTTAIAPGVSRAFSARAQRDEAGEACIVQLRAAAAALESPSRHGAEPILSALATSLHAGAGDATVGPDNLISAAIELLCDAEHADAVVALVHVALGNPHKVTGSDSGIDRPLAMIRAALKQNESLKSDAGRLTILRSVLGGFSALAARGLPEGAPRTEQTSRAEHSPDLASLAMAMCTACLGSAGAHRSSQPLLPPDVVTALLEVCAATGAPPAFPLWADLGYRRNRLLPGARPSTPTSVRLPLFKAVGLDKRRSSALRRATDAFRDPTSPPPLGVALPVSSSAYLWQARDGVWLEHNDCVPPDRVQEHRRRFGVDMAGGGAAGGERHFTFVLQRSGTDAPVDVAAWLNNAALVAAARPSGAVTTAAAAIRLVPHEAHPAVDVPAGVSNSARFVAALWREATGRIVHDDGVSEPARGGAVIRPSGAFLSAAFRLCTRGADLAYLRTLAAADGAHLEERALILAVRQAVRYGDVPLAHAFVEDAALRALATTGGTQVSALPEAAGGDSAGGHDDSSRVTPAQGGGVADEINPGGLFSHLLRAGGVPGGAASALVADAAAGFVPAGLPVHHSATPPDEVPHTDVTRAYCELVQACSARPASIQAVSAYYAMLQAGVRPR